MTVTNGTEDSLCSGFTEDDHELLRLVRAGRDDAFAELFARHAGPVRRYAMRCCTDVAEAEDMAAEAFFRVLQAVRRGTGPEDNIRGYLLTVVRRLAAEWSVRRRDVPVTDDELSRQLEAGHVESASRADQQLIARAFATLPQRWRTVLWRVEVEGERPAVVASAFGLSANATAALARRARQGLRAAYLQAHLAPAGGSTGCRSVVDKLGAYTAGQVAGAEAHRIRGHLAGCASCQALHAELADVCAGLRRYAGLLAPPLLGAAGPHLAAATAGKATLLAKGLLLGKTAKAALARALLGKAAVLGARIKLALAAASVAMVGGIGVLAGPLLAHPDFAADRGDGPNAPLLRWMITSSGSPGGSTGLVATSLDPTMRAELHGSRPTPPDGEQSRSTDPVAGSVASGAAALGQQSGTSQSTNPTGSDATSPTSAGGPARTFQLQQAPASQSTSTTTDPVSPTGSVTPTDTVNRAPLKPGSSTDTTPTTTTPEVTVWSTSWTTDGTTVWMTWWSQSSTG